MALRELLDKATPRPWTLNTFHDFAVGLALNVESPAPRIVFRTGGSGVEGDGLTDARLLAALANNAEAFIELWEATDAANGYIIGGIRDGEPMDLRLAQAVEDLRPLMEGDE